MRDPFDELIRALRAHGLSHAAESLTGVKATGWTTSSEMIGELGHAVLRIEAENPSLPEDLQRLLERCLQEVRKLWPDIRLQ